MSIRDIDKILGELSLKFNRIFYERDFICSVLEDFRVVLENKNKSCVVVIFPALGPNYLKAIQYQAELFDLATFTLGSRKLLCVGVCFKEYISGNAQSCEGLQTSNKMPETEPECSVRVRKKRPERQLYVPPAQRIFKNRNSDTVQKLENIEQKQNKHTIEKKNSKRRKSTEPGISKTKISDTELKSNNDDSIYQQNLHYLFNDFMEYFFWCYTFSVKWKYRVPENKSSFFRDSSVMKAYIFFKTFTKLYDTSLYRIPLYFCCPIVRLDILRRDIFLWQPKYYVHRESKISNIEVICDFDPILEVPAALPLPVMVENYSREINERNHDYYDFVCFKKRCSAMSDIYGLFVNYYFFIDDVTSNFDEETLDHLLGPESIHKSENVETIDLQPACMVSSIIQDSPEVDTTFDCVDVSIKPEECAISSRLSYESPPNLDVTPQVISETTTEVSSMKSSIQSRLDDPVKEKDIKERTEHDEEKEIMRRTKENINRRIKPIMKYVEDADNTLCINKDENLNNWEDLFDDDGQLHENLVKQIVKKVGQEVTIVKAKEDYTEYCSTKQIEEFEHMVELYDFPSTFETNDLIQAFSEIQSDAMYVKWVDDTHAILVLGSLAQAQKAVSLTSPIIKARPMTAASKAALNTAQRHDLRPAMKRPQTNLQTARRLITTHLGRKSGISQEKSAQERNDLRAAREQKRLVKKNEQDAWEGKLRSCLN
ncbi:unnamed protein product [Acanthoscelides obtectus]|uniref:Coiled-coil domain-containing protein R3HCC1L n=1 Tax=Acanthoscelides obtectus TaxID=200917 RepID=A0A9P0LM11_ACAOB|nr:unnamed protein product [Acanthoscelides obtectus]CAK1628711.1 Coiled-coil domain-containing protein R3HCC1L [Acanthoscelides obtectus]